MNHYDHDVGTIAWIQGKTEQIKASSLDKADYGPRSIGQLSQESSEVAESSLGNGGCPRSLMAAEAGRSLTGSRERCNGR